MLDHPAFHNENDRFGDVGRVAGDAVDLRENDHQVGCHDNHFGFMHHFIEYPRGNRLHFQFDGIRRGKDIFHKRSVAGMQDVDDIFYDEIGHAGKFIHVEFRDDLLVVADAFDFTGYVNRQVPKPLKIVVHLQRRHDQAQISSHGLGEGKNALAELVYFYVELVNLVVEANDLLGKLNVPCEQRIQ